MSSASAAFRVTFAVSIGLLALVACSLIVDPDSLVIKCDVARGLTAEDPCLPAGMHCVSSVCVPCEEAREICNGIDDDCDGFIDEGHDEDGDGFTWCGGGIPELADCNPTDPTVYPAAPQWVDGVEVSGGIELCDGKDNDCDGLIDENPECMQSGTCVTSGCPAGQRCDADSGRCLAQLPVGSGCTTDAECEGGTCVTPNALGLGVALMSSRCASACCSDADCGSGSVCVAGSSGARLCLPANIVARGTQGRGASCKAHDDCASGLCLREQCYVPCRSQADCEMDTCRLSPTVLGKPYLWVCDESSARSEGGQFCPPFDPTACKTGFCTERSRCAQPCATSAACGEGEACGYIDYNPLLTGAADSRLSLCQSASSVSETLCCTSGDCAPGSVCKPKPSGNHFEMVCVPR